MKRRRVIACEGCKGFQAETLTTDGRRLCWLCAHAQSAHGDPLADCSCSREVRLPSWVRANHDQAMARGMQQAMDEFQVPG